MYLRSPELNSIVTGLLLDEPLTLQWSGLWDSVEFITLLNKELGLSIDDPRVNSIRTCVLKRFPYCRALGAESYYDSTAPSITCLSPGSQEEVEDVEIK